MKGFLLQADRWLWRIDLVMIFIASVAVLAMMGLTFADVFFRYVFNAPLAWAYDLVTQYLLIGSFFFAFSYTLRVNENVNVDFFSRHLSTRSYLALMSLGHGVAAAIFLAVACLSAVDTWEAWKNNEAFVGALVWPTWSAKIIIPMGSLALMLRLAHRSLSYAAAVFDPSLRNECGLEDNHSMIIKEHA